MSLLLDTHYVYAIAGAPGRFSQTELEFLASYPDPFLISSVSVWEIRLKWAAKFASGERKGVLDPMQALRALASQPIIYLALSPEHAAVTLDVPLGQNDPFDELLMVQAQVEGVRLLTRDAKLKSHPLAFSVA